MKKQENFISLVGKVSKAPSFDTRNGNLIIKFQVENYNNYRSETTGLKRRQKTIFYVRAWNELAHLALPFLTEGTEVAITGKILWKEAARMYFLEAKSLLVV